MNMESMIEALSSIKMLPNLAGFENMAWIQGNTPSTYPEDLGNPFFCKQLEHPHKWIHGQGFKSIASATNLKGGSLPNPTV